MKEGSVLSSSKGIGSGTGLWGWGSVSGRGWMGSSVSIGGRGFALTFGEGTEATVGGIGGVGSDSLWVDVMVASVHVVVATVAVVGRGIVSTGAVPIPEARLGSEKTGGGGKEIGGGGAKGEVSPKGNPRGVARVGCETPRSVLSEGAFGVESP